MLKVGKRLSALVLVLVAGALVAGCGGDDASSPEDVVSEFYEATTDGDVETLCSLVTEETAQAAADDEGVETCEEGIEIGLESPEAEAAQAATEGLEVGEATIDGETATVAVSSEAGGSGDVSLVLVDDEWKVDLEGTSSP